MRNVFGETLQVLSLIIALVELFLYIFDRKNKN